MIHFSCKWCGKRYRAPDDCAGRADYCHECGRPVWVPQKHLHFACHGCGKKYRTPLKYAGATLPCRDCGQFVTAPRPAVKDPPPPPRHAAAYVPPADSPFELDPQPTARLGDDLDLVAYELLGDPDAIPDVADIDLVDFQIESSPPIDSQGRAPVVSPEIPVGRPYVPAAPPPLPPAAPPSLEQPFRFHKQEQAHFEGTAELPKLPYGPEPIRKQKGCRHCGCETAYTMESHSPVGIILMLAGAGGGLATFRLMEKDWRFGLATLALFGIAIMGGFMRRWVMLCSNCERRIY